MQSFNLLKGMTLLETLTVLFILSMLLVSAFPAWQKSHHQMILRKEQEKLYLFLRSIQGRVENSNEVWFLIPNRDQFKSQWCLVAQQKSDYRCDCFYPQLCPKSLHAQFYQPYYPKETALIAKNYYPKELTRLSGIRNTASTVCFVLQSGEARTVFSFFNVGSLKLKDYQSLSACIQGE